MDRQIWQAFLRWFRADRRRGSLVLFLVVMGIIAAIGVANMKPLPDVALTAAQKARIEANEKTRKAAAQQKRDREAAYEEYVGTYCRLELVCEKFSKVRQECATAGDFTKCLEVKLGDDLTSSYLCTNEGKIAYPQDPTPDLLECSIWKVKNWNQLP